MMRCIVEPLFWRISAMSSPQLRRDGSSCGASSFRRAAISTEYANPSTISERLARAVIRS